MNINFTYYRWCKENLYWQTIEYKKQNINENRTDIEA